MNLIKVYEVEEGGSTTLQYIHKLGVKRSYLSNYKGNVMKLHVKFQDSRAIDAAFEAATEFLSAEKVDLLNERVVQFVETFIDKGSITLVLHEDGHVSVEPVFPLVETTLKEATAA